MFCSFVLQTTFISYSGGNHLSTDESSSVLLFVHFLRESAPTIIWVSRSWGLPRSTLFISKKAPSLWHFQSIHTISKSRLRYFPCRQGSVKPPCPGLCLDQARTLQTSQSVRAWTFLYLVKGSDYPNAINDNRIHYNKTMDE